MTPMTRCFPPIFRLLEEVVNLENVPAKRGTLIALPIWLEGADAFPVRAVIVV